MLSICTCESRRVVTLGHRRFHYREIWIGDRRRYRTVKAFMGFLAQLFLRIEDLEYHLLRASIVILFVFFGYQKWLEEVQMLMPYISNGPLISCMYAFFGVRGASWLLGVGECSFGALLLLVLWKKSLSVLGAGGS
jgi:uncharacterized membrane protein YkgB